MKQTENEPYTRWQGFRINQLGLCISLFLTFAVATLGFSLHLLTRSEPDYPIKSCYARVFFFCSLIFGLISILSGCIACLTRLQDFRITAKVARDPSNTENDGLRDSYVRFGKWTWRLFRAQLLSFGMQVLGLVLAIGITYWSRLT